MLAQVWGRPTWLVLHGIAHTIAPADEAAKKTFVHAIRLLPDIMPCSSCRHEFTSVLQTNAKAALDDSSQHRPPEPSDEGSPIMLWRMWNPALWMFILHAHVVKGITERRVLKYLTSTVPTSVATPDRLAHITAAAIPPLSFQALTLRIALTDGTYFSRNDLWVMLALFSGATMLSKDTTPDRTLRVCAFAKDIVRLTKDIASVRDVARALEAGLCKVKTLDASDTGVPDAPDAPDALLQGPDWLVLQIATAFGMPFEKAKQMSFAALVETVKDA